MHAELTNDLSSISGWKNSGIFVIFFFEMDLAFPSGFSSGGWFPYRVTNVALAECFPVFSNTMQPRATRQHSTLCRCSAAVAVAKKSLKMPFAMALDGLLWSKLRGETALGMAEVGIDIAGFR